LASNTVTVIVLVAAPSATTLAGEEFTVDVVASGTSALNVKVAVCVIDTPAATALITAVPEVIEDTVPLVCPAASVAPAGCAMVSVAPLEELNVTFTPGTGLLLASNTVTVIVLVADPSATRVVGLPTTVELAADGVLATNVTSAVSTTFTVPFTTALMVEVPVVMDETVPVITPDALVDPTGCVIVSVAPLEELKTTVAPGTGLLFTSRTVTVIVLVAAPSATTLAGEEFTVEVVALATSGLNVSVSVWVIKAPPASALIIAVPEVVEETVPVV
jgi:hypothetical protein